VPRRYEQGTRAVCEEKIYLEQEFIVGREPPLREDLRVEAKE
jgi:hypothetical protein